MDIPEYNRDAWNRQVEIKNPWTQPVSHEEIEAARHGSWTILLTPKKAVPHEWFGKIQGANVLCLASGGGQQGPILAAVGAHVTVLDNSPAQLAQDEKVANREQLEINVELGQMENLSRFSDATFDLIVHPVSNLFTANIRKVWREAYRVLTSGGALLAGFSNPANYLFDYKELENGNYVVRYSLPYSDQDSLSADDLRNGDLRCHVWTS